MKTTGYRWNVATVIVQSIAVFCITYVLFTFPPVWGGSYASILGGQELPGLTQVIVSIPSEVALCLSIMVSTSHLCVGLILLATSTTELMATQRTLFFSATTCGIVLFAVLFVAVALGLPFVRLIGKLSTDEELQNRAERIRLWTTTTCFYCVTVLISTVLICLKSRKVEPETSVGHPETGRP